MKDKNGTELKDGDRITIFAKRGRSYEGRVEANKSMFTGKKTLGLKAEEGSGWLLGICSEKQVLKML